MVLEEWSSLCSSQAQFKHLGVQVSFQMNSLDIITLLKQGLLGKVLLTLDTEGHG